MLSLAGPSNIRGTYPLSAPPKPAAAMRLRLGFQDFQVSVTFNFYCYTNSHLATCPFPYLIKYLAN